MIEKIREFIATCPHIKEFSNINVNYLVDKTNAYSINEAASYNPVISVDTTGNKEMQFLFNLDAKLHWNEELKNNIDNSMFFEKFRDWLENNDNNNVYPEIDGIQPMSISATTNGYIFTTNSDEAIYRISCKFQYYK